MLKSSFIAFLMPLFLLSAFILQEVEANEGRVVSLAAGQAQDHIVTSREVELSFLIEAALFEEGKSPAAVKKADIKSPAFVKKVTAVLLEWSVYFEAQNFATVKVAENELQEAEEKAWERLKDNARWKELEPVRSEVRQMIRRKFQAKEFIRFKADASSVPITDGEARKYFEQNRLKFGNLPFENFRDTIKTFLAREQMDERLKDWFDVLQSKYQVRNFLAEI